MRDLAKAAEYQKRYRDRNRELVRERDRLAKAAIPIEIKRAINAAWRARQPEEWRERQRVRSREREQRLAAADPDYYSKKRMSNLERTRERARARYKLNPTARIAEATRQGMIRRARKAGNGVSKIIDRDWRRMLARYRGCCAYCSRPSATLHKEHVIPIARGGRHSIGNLLPVCPSCNRSKGARLLVEWRARQRRGLAA